MLRGIRADGGRLKGHGRAASRPALGVDLSEVPGRISHVPLQLTIPGDIFTAVGLLLDAVGVVFLFWYAPEKIPDPQSAVGDTSKVLEEARKFSEKFAETDLEPES